MTHSVGAVRGSFDVTTGLQKIPLLTQAPRELQRAFERVAKAGTFGNGVTFLREGEACPDFAIVVSGRMRVFKPAENGHEITLYTVGPGEGCPLNAASILSSCPACAMSSAEEPVDAVLIPAPAFRTMVAGHEALRSFVLQMFSTRMSEVMCLVEEVAFHRMDERLARRMMRLLDRDGGPCPSVEVTHAELAADLGTAREVVSRRLKKLERLGAITLLRGRIEIRNAARLRALVSGQP